MQTFKIPQSSSDLPYVVRNMRQQTDRILQEFCVKKVLEKQLSTKSFNYAFDFSNARSGGQRKSVHKLRDIIFKAVKKRVPYLDYTKGGEFVVNTSSGNSVNITLYSPSFRVGIRKNSSDLARFSETNRYSTLIGRYCRFLRYKAIRLGIPLAIFPTYAVESHPADKDAFDEWNSSASRKTYEGRFIIKTVLKVSLAYYSYQAYRTQVARSDNRISTYDAYETNLMANGNSDAKKLFRHANAWSCEDFPRRGGAYTPGSEKYLTPEKIFLVLDELQKIIITLSRKTSYDTTAFNIGSEASS